MYLPIACEKKSLKQKTQKDKAENKKNKWITWITVEDVNIFEKIKFQIFQEIKKRKRQKWKWRPMMPPKYKDSREMIVNTKNETGKGRGNG